MKKGQAKTCDVAVIGGGAGWYFKIYRPKHEKAAEPEEDYGGELDGYDGGEPYGDEEDDGPPWDEEDDDGEEADKCGLPTAPLKK